MGSGPSPHSEGHPATQPAIWLDEGLTAWRRRGRVVVLFGDDCATLGRSSHTRHAYYEKRWGSNHAANNTGISESLHNGRRS
jgi:hypothetical protein